MSNKDKQPVKVTSCGAITWRLCEGRPQILLIKQFEHNDAWSIPKGHINEGESIEDCAMREVKEETGVDIVLEMRLSDTVVNIKGGTKTVVAFLARPEGTPVINLENTHCEVADARWFDVDALPELQFYQRELILNTAKRLSPFARS